MKSKNLLTLLAFLSLHFTSISSSPLSCYDPSGNAVAWSLIIKYPANLTTDDAHYSYIDSNSAKASFQILPGLPDAEGGPIYNTITSINGVSEDDINLLLWNDEVPSDSEIRETEGTAHSKGALAFDNSTNVGVYLLHSAPKYPGVDDYGNMDYVMPGNTDTYGQHLYCMTVNANSFNTIVGHIEMIDPTIYWASGVFYKKPFDKTTNVWINSFTLTNNEFHWMLSKNAYYFPYLYEDVIQPFFGLGLQVSSWGRPYLDSFCPPQIAEPVVNVNQIQFAGTNYTWDKYSDHSKWAVTTGSDSVKWACLCDMNRMETQNNRGGSCACTQNKNIYGALTSIIVDVDECSSGEEEYDVSL